MGRFLIRMAMAAAVSFAGFAWDGNTDEAAWLQLTAQVEAKRTRVAELIAEANAAKLNTDYAYVSQVVLDLFKTYGQYDRGNPAKVREAFDTFNYPTRIGATVHIELPFDEMQACLEVADHAISELERQLAGSIELKDTVDFSTGKISIGPQAFRRDGESVFPSSFTWMDEEEHLLKAFGRMGGMFYQLTSIRVDGTINPWNVTNESGRLADQSARNLAPQVVFIGHAAAGWMKTEHPEILHGERNFTRYDTDSPLIRGWMDTLIEGMIPPASAASGDQPRIHLLANEPNFATKSGGWLAANGVSENTMVKYRDWLAEKYGTIGSLNTAYGKAYADFEAAKAGMAMPIPTNLRGGPIWYDWCRFNMDRINDWFSFLKDGTQRHDPEKSPVTIKILGGQLSSTDRDDGMDMEFLTKLQGVTGADLHMVPRGYENFNLKETEWESHYTLDWVEQSLYLDFVKSISPEKPYYDSEWHGLSTGRWRHPSMDRNYVRAALWLAFTQGMGAINAWVWGRELDGSPKLNAGGLYGDLLTQPTALDSFGRTMKELNAHAKTVTRFVPENRVFMIYYCEDSAIQDPQYIKDLSTVYESLKLLNLPVGFTTPSEIGTLSKTSQTVVVPPTPFISDAALSGIEAFAASGGKVGLVGASQSFGKRESGAPRNGAATIASYATIEYGEAFALADGLKAALGALIPDRLVALDIKDGNGIEAYGVVAFETLDKATGEATLALINVSKDSRVVALRLPEGNGGSYRNAITGEAIASEQALEPYDVLLVQTVGAKLAGGGWVEFVEQHGLSGDPLADFDQDGRSDYFEYAFGGNPTVPSDLGHAPSFRFDGEEMLFSSSRLMQDDPGISYFVEWTEDLANGPWSRDWGTSPRTAPIDDDNYEVSQPIDWNGRAALFFRVKIEGE